TLTLRNAGRRTLQWTISMHTRGEAIDQETAPILVETVTGTLPPGESEPVLVRVSDPAVAISGGGNYELSIEVLDQEGVVTVPIILESVALPVIIASDPPDENSIGYTLKSTLDFNRQDTQLEFWVVNIGPLESRLYFQVQHEDEGIENPLVVDVSPMAGDTNGPDGVFAIGEGRYVDARRVVVTVDRTAMTEDVEYRDLYIEAWDEDGEARIDAVPPWKVQIRVERPPMTVEGALNRSRPPYLMRFVFMLRDTLGRVIPTQTDEDMEKVDFVISENGSPIDLGEVSMQVEGPDQLKVNMVLLLDYTGSMYNAGVDDPTLLRQPGEVLQEVQESVEMFLDDLPSSYRVALMYHNDRQPLNRVIHPLSTNRESLKSALRSFEVPPQLHGTSDIWDAIIDAVDRLAAADSATTLPFDDADIRAVVFITDGNDNSSESGASAASSAAVDQRVRLYPLTYSSGVSINYPDLIPLAEDSGGHFYNAGTADKLVRLLGHKRSLVLSPVTYNMLSSTAEFKIHNAGQSPLTWSILEEGFNPWLTRIFPASGTTQPGADSLVTVTVDPVNLANPYGVGKGVLTIQSNDGKGEVEVMLTLESGTTTIQQLSLSLRDEPGQVWQEMQNQVVLSYVTPSQAGGNYSIRVNYTQDDDKVISGFFEENGVFYPGDVRAGQISLHTTGINIDYAAETWEEVAQAEVYVRADYVPRYVNIFRNRFVPLLGADISPEVAAAFLQHSMKVELAPEGLLLHNFDAALPNWRLVPENDGIYRMLTPKEYALPYASNGNLLRITFSNLWPFIEAAEAAGIEPEFFLDMRVDNSMYYAPATDAGPSETVYFL
ncbi:MAG: VWA domain-containing protein, partial [Candidatus Hydrogenedentes bacterium]|nr:VWA domain-containing protein [Candidatus Hydrogenedentota bacterium]